MGLEGVCWVVGGQGSGGFLFSRRGVGLLGGMQRILDNFAVTSSCEYTLSLSLSLNTLYMCVYLFFFFFFYVLCFMLLYSSW